MSGAGPAGRPLTLRANVSWTVAGNVVYAASQWGVVVVLAKLLDTAAVGRFALALAIASPIVLLAGLSLRSAQATDARGEYVFGDYLALRIVTTAAALALIAVIAAIVGGTAGAVVALVGLAKASEALSDVAYGLQQRHERLDLMARSMMARGPLALVAMAGVVALTGSLAWGAAAMAAAWGAVLLAYDLPTARRLLAGEPARPRWSAPTLRRLAWLAAPLGIATGLISLSANIPRYAVERHLGESELGVFAAIAYLAVAGTTVVNAIGQAAAPRLANHHARGERFRFNALVAKLVGIAAAVGIAAVAAAAVVGRPVLAFVYDDEYARRGLLLWIMGAATVTFVATVLGYALTAAREFRPQAPLFAVTTVVVAAAAFALVPAIGVEGAAAALAIGGAVQIGGTLLIMRTARARPPVPSAQAR